MSVLLLILGLILFVALVVVHEFGHYIAARRNSVEVEEFGIGFPPMAWKRKLKNGVLFTLNWLPLGGFVRLKGEHDADREEGSYGRASLSAKTKIMTAGVGMNLLTAFIILTALAWVGMPKLIDNQFTVANDTKISKSEVLVGYVEPDSPAQKAGIKVQDQIAAITKENESFTPINKVEDLPSATQKYAGQKVTVFVRDSNDTRPLEIQLRSKEEVEASKNSDNPKGYLGISPAEYVLQRSTWSAPIVALGLMKQFTVLTLQGLGHAIGALFSGHGQQASEQVAGPVGIFVILKDGSLLGYQFILVIIAVISLTLAIMNILPIPALDGGRLFVTLLFHATNRKLTRRREELIHGTGFALLMVLFVLITIVDVKRFL
jgi:regulator of sigma E protease